MHSNSQALPPSTQTGSSTAACFAGGEACRLEVYKLVNKLPKIYPQPEQDPFLSAIHLQAAVLAAKIPAKRQVSPPFLLWSFSHPGSTATSPYMRSALGCQVMSLAVAQPKQGLIFHSDSSYLAVTLPPHILTSKCIFVLNSSL